MTELKPCPFCGGKAMLSDVDDRDDPFVIVLCEKCGIQTPKLYYYDPISGINCLDLAKTRVSEKWNRRINNDAERAIG